MTKQRKSKSKTMITQRPVDDERRHLWIVCALVAAGFVVYANTLFSSFHFDDILVIVNNPAIRRLWDWPALFNAFNTRFVAGWTFALNYALGALDVFGYHFFNIWLHVCNAVLLYTFVLQLLNLTDRSMPPARAQWMAGTAAFIFLLHPIQTQAVNYVWQRTTLLAVFFYLGAVVLYVHGRVQGQRGAYRLALVSAFVAMFCKEIAFTLPLVIVMLEAVVLRKAGTDKRSAVWLAPFLILLLVIPMTLQRAGSSTLGLMRGHDMMSGVTPEIMTPQDYRLTQINVLVTYLRLVIWPTGQSVDHAYPLASQSGWGWWGVCLVVLITIFVAGFVLRRRQPLLAVGAFWFFLTLSVESLVVSADLLVEHRMYLPMSAVSLAAALFFDQLAFRRRRFVSVLLVALLVALSALSFARNMMWRNDVELWSDVIQKAPRKARAYNNRGAEYKKMGFLDLALRDLTRAVEIDPNYAPAFYNRGGVYKVRKEFDLAAADYARVIELEPQNFQGFDARGYIFRRQGRYEEALRDFTASIALNPHNPEVFNNRAYIYQKQGKSAFAIEDYTRAIEADPTYIYAYNNRGNLYLEEGRYESAVSDYTRAIALKSDFSEAYMNRAVAYFHLKRFKDSWQDVRRAQSLGLSINPQFLNQLTAASEFEIP